MKVLLDPLFSLLTLLILSFHSDPSTSSASSSPPPSLSLQNCTNSSCGSLSNISFPFSLAASPNITSSDNSPASCGLPEFRLICSSSSPFGTVTWWPESMHPLCSIRNITSNHASHGTFVTGPLSASPPVNACSPVQVEQLLSLPPPTQVGLEFFPQSNIVLLINCSTDLTANLRINDTVYNSFSFSSPNCLRYYSVCYHKDSTKAPCLEAISADANITHVKNTYGCTYNLTLFELPTKSDMALSLQMEWWISQSYYDCRACEGSNGNCSIDNRTGGFQCSCLDGRPASIGNICGPVQSSLSSCKGLCQSSVRIFLGVMAIAAAIVIGTAGLCVYYRWHNRQSATPCAGGGRKPNSNNSNEDKLKQMLVKEVGPFLESTQTFTYRELFEATNGFSEGKLLGDGGFATVFEGTLASTGQKVAVKRMYSENKDRLQQFLNEIRILVTLNHPNLVKLHGFCCESYEELLLVYEFAPNGSLADNLHGMAGKGLLWETRLCIALETARALTYLHQRDLPILHRDVKSSNILLDENFHAKLGDFGLSRQVYSMKASHISTAPQGTPGYVDPQYHQCYQLTDKSDVYSFGVVLLELISGKAPVDMSRRHTHINLSSLAVSKIQTGALHELFDPFLEVTRYSAIQHMVKRVAELAFLCLAPLQEDRPSMSSVALALLDVSESAYPPSSYTSPDSMSLFDKTWPNSTNSTMGSGCCSSSTHTDPDNVPSTATSPDLL